ncbi:MAG: 50S ribosomal protein L10 [Gemmatimonadetes bacterium]|nr:50S ribosomal protein L10 [Gemmatimonadota bacterium]
MDQAAAIFLADFTGLNVEQMTDLRRKCRAEGVRFEVIKNTLAIKACSALELGELAEHLKGPTAMATATEDPASPARILIDFHKEHEKPEVKLGFIDGKVLTADEVKALSKLPTRDQLISQVMQLAQAPAQGFVGTLNAVLSELVRTVDAVRDGMEKGTIKGAAAAEEAPAAPVAAEADSGGDESAAEETTEESQSEDQKDGE